MIAIINAKILGLGCVFAVCFIWACCILANLKWNNPRWFQCTRCKNYRNDLGVVQVVAPPDVEPREIEHELCPECRDVVNAYRARRICAWCKTDMGAAQTQHDSHGICGKCAEKV